MTDQKMAQADQALEALPTLLIREEEARSPVRVSLTLDKEQLATLADQYGLQSVSAFALKATGSRVKGGRLRVEGSYTANVTYLCGVTLQPFDAELEEQFDQIYVDPERLKPQGDAIDVDPLSESDPDVLVSGAADVADLAYQLFALALDPYPRHPDATEGLFPAGEGDADGSEVHGNEAEPSPFAVLKDLKLN